MARIAPAPGDRLDATPPAAGRPRRAQGDSRRRRADDRLSALLFTGINLAVFLALFGCVIAAGYLFSQGY